jgi:negative regulator of flagellin synthesis FlgM
MIISNKQVQSILQLDQVSAGKKKVAAQDAASTKKTDSLVLSEKAQELNFTKDQVLKSPEVRVDRIGELKKQIQEGNYQISGDQIASKMIGRSLADELFGR